MNQRNTILVAFLVLGAAGVVVWASPLIGSSIPSDGQPTVQEEYEPLTEVKGSEIILRGNDTQIQVRYTTNIQYCTVRDSDTGDTLEEFETVEVNDVWEYGQDEVFVTCQPTGDGYVDTFPQQQEYSVEIE